MVCYYRDLQPISLLPLRISLTFPVELKLISTNLTIYECMAWKKMQLTHLSLFMSWSIIDHITTIMYNIVHPSGLSQSQVNQQFKWFTMSQQLQQHKRYYIELNNFLYNINKILSHWNQTSHLILSSKHNNQTACNHIKNLAHQFINSRNSMFR